MLKFASPWENSIKNSIMQSGRNIPKFSAAILLIEVTNSLV